MHAGIMKEKILQLFILSGAALLCVWETSGRTADIFGALAVIKPPECIESRMWGACRLTAKSANS